MSHLDSVAEINIGNEHSAILPSNTNSLWSFHKTSFVTWLQKTDQGYECFAFEGDIFQAKASLRDYLE